LKALGIEKDSNILKEVTQNEEFSSDMYINMYTSEAKNKLEALEDIGKKLGYSQSPERRVERAEQVLDRYLLPHVGHKPEDRIYKAHYICRLVRKLLYTSASKLKEDDKDHYGNKRLRLVGDSLETLLRYIIRRLVDDLKYNFERLVKRKKFPSLQGITRSKVLTSRVRSALATGEWIGDRHGVSQHLERLNHFACISHLRRVISLLTSSKENFAARDLHPTHWGKLCTSETPEGQPIGLRKNLAITAEVSTGEPLDREKLLQELKKAGMKKLGTEGVDVSINGKLIGIHSNPNQIIKALKKIRKESDTCPEINYFWNTEENIINLSVDGGRIRRPLIIVENGKTILTPEHLEKLKNNQMTWKDLVKKGIIEYLDADEEENSLIAINQEDISKGTTHLEISPAVIFGTQTAMIPYAEHTLSPRVLYGAKMMKQGLGMFATNFPLQQNLADIAIKHYPQRPIVQTFMNEILNYDSHPIGQNIVIAVITGKGYNMEDAVVINKATLERGAYRATYFTPYKTEELKYPGGQFDRIETPDKDIKGYRLEEYYNHLEQDGIAYIDARLKEGEVLIGKTSPPRFLSSLEEFRVNIESRMETSVTMDRMGSATVTSVIITENENGNRFVKTRVRDQTIPEIGDKFASRHGQKGIIGMIIPEEDVPFTASGVKPDLLFSPHSIPGRMTIGQLVEMLGGKVGALQGRQVDGSAFTGEHEEELRKQLFKMGFREDGAETMYNGITGEQFQARIFIAPAYYLRLSHMVKNKFHVRSRGPVQLLTRQPTEGKSKSGGLRLGEMEKECFIAHGASLLLKERWDSDKAQIPICKNCGITAIYNEYTSKGVCPICGEDSPIIFVEMAYAFKLFLDELKSMCIYPKMNLQRK
ncbi:MAG: DNA-directed RNA polymerase subunit B, partial [Nanoarchaeota archaeon]|nr:DNA-directed RNA polymerase subunit B [Nanoarchaeota archaeon]